MLRHAIPVAIAASALMALSACDESSGAGSRDQIKIVGSSTVYPFATAVAEQFAKKNPGFKSPIVEATGTGGGIKAFCGGIGAEFPDIATASRRLKPSEYESCREAGAGKIAEIQIGLDGIAFAENKGGPELKLTTLALYKALAARPFGQPQTSKVWKDVDPALPAVAIRVYGPPATSGTRDALAELIMARGCDTDESMRQLKDKDPDEHKAICTTVREDGPYVEAGENDNLIVQKLSADKNALGIFGYSFLEENPETLNGNSIGGIAPTYASISDFSYPGARPLYMYVKLPHIAAIRGLKEYLAELESAWGRDGYLRKRGMVVAPADALMESAATIANLTPLDPAKLK